jgi:hypothetical protein
VQLTFLGSGDAFAGGGRFQACLHLAGGAEPLLLDLDGQFSRRTGPLRIAGPVGVAERVNATFEALYPGATSVERAFETTFGEFSERTPYELGPARITPFEVRHSSGSPSYALRVEYGGKVIAYLGDAPGIVAPAMSVRPPAPAAGDYQRL